MSKNWKCEAAEAAAIAGCSLSTIRKKLTPVEVETFHVRHRGDVVRYRYSRRDAERLRDGQPIRKRKHPNAAAARELSSRAKSAAETRAVGREIADEAWTLEIRIPESTPTCCQRHATNHVRHEGTSYESVLAYRRDAKGYSSADTGYSDLRGTLDRRIRRALQAVDRWPAVADCVPQARSVPGTPTPIEVPGAVPGTQ